MTLLANGLCTAGCFAIAFQVPAVIGSLVFPAVPKVIVL